MKNTDRVYIVIFEIFILILLTLHTYHKNYISDYVTILFLVLMTIVPLIPKIEWLKYGPFETTLREQYLLELEEDVESIPEMEPVDDPYEDLYQLVYSIGLENVAAAILTIRVEVEKTMRLLYQKHIDENKKNISLSKILTQLIHENVIDIEMKHGLLSWIDFFNQVTHGAPVILEDDTDFEIIVRSGIKIVKYLNSLLDEEIYE